MYLLCDWIVLFIGFGVDDFEVRILVYLEDVVIGEVK